jgi:hypothetical protein
VGTQYLIFAWNNEDPVTGNNDWKYHGTKQRSQRATMLLNFKSTDKQNDDLSSLEIMTQDFRVDNVKNYLNFTIFE